MKFLVFDNRREERHWRSVFNNVKPQGNVCQKTKLQQCCTDLKKGRRISHCKACETSYFWHSSFKKPFLKKAGFPLNVLLEQAKICGIFGGHAALQHCCRNVEGKNHLMAIKGENVFRVASPLHKLPSTFLA